MTMQIAGTAPRLLIVNADDFGLSEGVNRGIVRAHEQGIVTSASLMVRQPGAGDAAAYARARPGLSVGLHLDLGEWIYRNGGWSVLYEVVPADDAAAVSTEVSRQLDMFVQLVGRPPTHLDSHQHVHQVEPLRSITSSLAHALSVPLRHFSPRITYCGDFYGQSGKGQSLHDAITPEALVRVIRSLSSEVTEMACHPGDDCELRSAYRNERAVEVASLCHPSVGTEATTQNVRLISFHEFAHSHV